MTTRRLAGPSGRAVAIGVGIAAVLLGAGGVVLVGQGASDEATGPDHTVVTPADAEPSDPASPDVTPASTPSAVPAGELRIRRPVPLDVTARFGGGLSLRVTDVTPVRGVARGPGEIAGPAVRLTVQISNQGHRAVSLESVVLSVSYGGAETPAVTLTGSGARPFGGDVEPGRSQTAQYVFAIPAAERGDVQVVATYTGSAPGVELIGSVA